MDMDNQIEDVEIEVFPEDLSEDRALAIRNALAPARGMHVLAVQVPTFEIALRDAPTSIASQTEADDVVRLVRELREERSRIEEAFKRPAEEAFQFHRAGTGLRAKAFARIDPTIALANAVLGEWEKRKAEAARLERERIAAEQRRIAEAEAEAARAKAEREHEERIEAALEEAENFRLMGAPEHADVILASVPVAPMIPSRPVAFAPSIPAPAPTEGLRLGEKWIGRVTDLGAFLAWVAADPAGRGDLVKIEQAKLNAKAKSLKGAVNIPGVEQVKETTAAVR